MPLARPICAAIAVRVETNCSCSVVEDASNGAHAASDASEPQSLPLPAEQVDTGVPCSSELRV